MSAQLDILPLYRRMAARDLDDVMAIESRVYTHPWTRGNFMDSMTAGHHCWIANVSGTVVGYSVAALGAELLRFMLKLIRDYAAARVFLEVRPSNTAARALYRRAGFSEIGTRRGYYPAQNGREDALVLELVLR